MRVHIDCSPLHTLSCNGYLACKQSVFFSSGFSEHAEPSVQPECFRRAAPDAGLHQWALGVGLLQLPRAGPGHWTGVGSGLGLWTSAGSGRRQCCLQGFSLLEESDCEGNRQ